MVHPRRLGLNGGSATLRSPTTAPRRARSIDEALDVLRLWAPAAWRGCDSVSFRKRCHVPLMTARRPIPPVGVRAGVDQSNGEQRRAVMEVHERLYCSRLMMRLEAVARPTFDGPRSPAARSDEKADPSMTRGGSGRDFAKYTSVYDAAPSTPRASAPTMTGDLMRNIVAGTQARTTGANACATATSTAAGVDRCRRCIMRQRPCVVRMKKLKSRGGAGWRERHDPRLGGPRDTAD